MTVRYFMTADNFLMARAKPVLKGLGITVIAPVSVLGERSSIWMVEDELAGPEYLHKHVHLELAVVDGQSVIRNRRIL
jgi:hypothetical protein